jgi:hypothetical protein
MGRRTSLEIDLDCDKILKTIQDNGPMTPAEIQSICKISKAQWKLRMRRLMADGKIAPETRLISISTGRFAVISPHGSVQRQDEDIMCHPARYYFMGPTPFESDYGLGK